MRLVIQARPLENRLITKHLRGIHNAWQFWFESVLVFTAQWLRSGGLRCSPLNAALYASGISEQDVFDTSNIGCYLPADSAVPRRRGDRLE
ncbi:hypothetical protein EIC00_20865 [Vibrio parahaemolyticus]|nr:hypothetical protein [Vibrio parahaemolyticus]EGR3234391.1 hypothetical protein [Vibrio parahaemolyticus]